MRWVGGRYSEVRKKELPDQVKAFLGCSFEVSKLTDYPWEQIPAYKLEWRTCRSGGIFEHDGKFYCTHHAKALALRYMITGE